ncbi:MAG: AraC family transcriptional regulator [Mucilaginibacter sp.]
MKPLLLKVNSEVTHSFRARQEKQCNINNRWHYHPEVELIYFHKGSGTQFVGDSITRFNAGDMVLIGSNLPHHWKFDEDWADMTDNIPYSTVIHFFDNFLGETFLKLPENKTIKNTIESASRGLQIMGNAKKIIGQHMQEILDTEGPKRILALIEILITIGDCSEKKPICSLGFSPNFQEEDKDRINSIYEFSLANYKKKILLEEIAEVANLSPNSFCRYFKLKTKKTYSQFINEIRIGHACKLLIENNINVKQICYESGFNNFSSFHAIFKSVTGKTPLHYQSKYLLNSEIKSNGYKTASR